MTPGAVVAAAAEHRPVVLSDMEVIGPRSQRIGQLAQRRIERVIVAPIEVLRQNRVLGSVGAQHVEQGVRHVGLESQGGIVHSLEHLEHVLPTVHGSPADLALGGKGFSVVLRDRRSLPERLDHVGRVAGGILGPVLDSASGVDAHDAIGADPPLA